MDHDTSDLGFNPYIKLCEVQHSMASCSRWHAVGEFSFDTLVARALQSPPEGSAPENPFSQFVTQTDAGSEHKLCF